MTELFAHKDNEFIAWYPNALSALGAEQVWQKKRAAYYVHIPFCTAICDYCGFAVQRLREGNVTRYLAALRNEIQRYADEGRLRSYRFDCGHFGGGTPSAIDAEQLLMIKQTIDGALDVAPDAEVTVEVNPISFDRQKAERYRAAGVNRISFGLQSFSDRTLRVIGRPHRAVDVRRTLRAIEEAGFQNFSLDLIYGVPGQTMGELDADLRRVVDTGATHVSCFRLEIIPFTLLKLREAAQQLPERLSVDVLNEMDELVSSVLTAHGYHEYGAFNFARPGYESVHNEIAFMAPQGEYVGFGNSAYSFINGFVYTNHALLGSYMEAIEDGRDPIALAQRVNDLEMMSRYFVLGIKFFRVSRARFIERFGLPPEQCFGSVLDELATAGLVSLEGDDYVLSRRGRQYVNNICKQFYVGATRGKRQHLQFVSNLTTEQIDYYAQLSSRSRAEKPESEATV